MSARKDADLNGDLAHILEAAAIETHTFFDYPLADAILELLVEELAEDVDVLRKAFAQVGDRLLAQLVGAAFASGLVGAKGSLVEPQRQVLTDHLHHLVGIGGRGELALGPSDLLLKLELSSAQLLDGLVRHRERVDD